MKERKKCPICDSKLVELMLPNGFICSSCKTWFVLLKNNILQPLKKERKS